MKKYKIAQSGLENAKPADDQQYNWQSFQNPVTPQVPVTDPLARMQLDPNQAIPVPGLEMQYKKAKKPFEGIYDLNPYVKLFNMAARLTTGVANQINEAKNTKQEYKDFNQALQPANWESTTEDGLNDKPAYYKTGGSTISKEEAYAILKQGSVKGHKLSRQQKIFFRKIAKTGKIPPKGSIHQTGGEPNQIIEAEQGEVFQNTDGDLQKVPESAPRHEDGGYVLDNASRVLEDTSDKRKDRDSKLLKLSPALVSLLTGFDSNQEMTHSKAMEHAHKHIEKQVKKFETNVKKNVDQLYINNEDPYANNSLKLNMMQMQNIPTPGEIFDTLFAHQELLKGAAGIDNPKAKCGGKYKMAQLGTYAGGKTTLGATTPTDRPNAFGFPGGLQAYKDAWKDIIDLSQYKTAADAQRATYAFLVQNAPDVIQNMWSQNGLTELGRTNAPALQKLGIEMVKDKHGRLTFKDASSLTPAQLAGLNDLAYSDNMLGIRTLTPKSLPEPTPTTPTPTPDVPPPTTPLNLRDNPKSRFFEPLHFFDVAGPLNGLMEGRIPVRHNPAQLEQVRLHLQNPLPTLQQGERDYTAALDGLPSNTLGYANQANLFSKKYAMDNQVLGQYENINADIKNKEIIGNADIRGRQSLLDQQAREVTERKYLGSKEAQRAQNATSLNELYTRLAQNRKLNREGSLLMNLFPAFDQNANYNGYNIPIRMPLATPNVPVSVPLPAPEKTKGSTSKANNILISPITGKKFTF